MWFIKTATCVSPPVAPASSLCHLCPPQMMIDQSRKKLLADFEQWAAVMVRQRQATEASTAAGAGFAGGMGGAGSASASQMGSPQSARSRPGSVRPRDASKSLAALFSIFDNRATSVPSKHPPLKLRVPSFRRRRSRGARRERSGGARATLRSTVTAEC